jgi:chromosome partitioning protein
MSQSNKPHIFVVGNEKGGAGKTTCSMHLIVSLLDKGYKVASIDTDSRQASLSSYIKNRTEYNARNPEQTVMSPLHFHIKESTKDEQSAKNSEEEEKFTQILNDISSKVDYIVIDTPGSYSYLSRLSHSYADTVITPINDSFIDLDVIAKIDMDRLDYSKPSIYSQMLWEQKMVKVARDGGTINWVIMRNRLSNINANNKRSVHDALEALSKKIAFKIAPGFSERVIFRELFLHGLTLIDLNRANYNKNFNVSHVAARQELRDFIACLGIK